MPPAIPGTTDCGPRRTAAVLLIVLMVCDAEAVATTRGRGAKVDRRGVAGELSVGGGIMFFDRSEGLADVLDGAGSAERVTFRHRLGGFAIGGSLGFAFARRFVAGVDIDALYGGGDGKELVHGSVAVALQYWPASRVWTKAGLGKGTLEYPFQEPLLRDANALSMNAAIGFELIQHEKWAWDMELRSCTARYDVRVVNVSLHTGVQYYVPLPR